MLINKIQYIYYDYQNNSLPKFVKYQDNIENMDFNDIKDIRPFNGYDVNIIDLNYESLWRITPDFLTGGGDFVQQDEINNTIKTFQNNQKTKYLILLPQNFLTNINLDPFDNDTYLYNRISYIEDLIKRFVKNKISLGYENNNETVVNNKTYLSDFHFIKYPKTFNKVLVSNNNKITTIFRENVGLSTIKFNDFSEIKSLCNVIFSSEPSWINEIECIYDYEIKEQRKIVEKAENKLSDLEEKNSFINKLFYAKGKDLEEVVIHVFKTILSNDEDVTDSRKEDFQFVLSNEITLVGEIKGTKNNLSEKHVTQLDKHLKRIDENYTDLKGILVINHQIDKKISSREQLSVSAVELAEQYHQTILKTSDLFYFYKQYLNGEIDKTIFEKNILETNGVLEFQLL